MKLPMGAAPMAYVLWTRHLRHNPTNPKWPDRDRFVLSAGHASMLSTASYSSPDTTLTSTISSNSANGEAASGHPEYGEVPGLEATTILFGQALGKQWDWQSRNAGPPHRSAGHEVVNHHTYVMASDGDMMEGVRRRPLDSGSVSARRLIVLYDANQITSRPAPMLPFTEDLGARLQAYRWHVEHIDAMDIAAVEGA